MKKIVNHKGLIFLLSLLFLMLAIISFSGNASNGSVTTVPALHEWQAIRITKGFAHHQRRPLFKVVGIVCRTKYRCRVKGNEPGYLGDAPDVTIATVERRGYQFWIKDPLEYEWHRWL